ncbi:hypothetical protein CPB84DRAFT_1744809 [Gymnopilus junonius]|uniref:Uncharacterized protein n=1 Tax=Gymnopilus junonius TaxID=109634 RepID=A0A9P5TQN6_GYMJU|nr:hypothetical protein CPB84DRAFT_1744809 [Gymnopilus junonius]
MSPRGITVSSLTEATLVLKNFWYNWSNCDKSQGKKTNSSNISPKSKRQKAVLASVECTLWYTAWPRAGMIEQPDWFRKPGNAYRRTGFSALLHGTCVDMQDEEDILAEFDVMSERHTELKIIMGLPGRVVHENLELHRQRLWADVTMQCQCKQIGQTSELLWASGKNRPDLTYKIEKYGEVCMFRVEIGQISVDLEFVPRLQ